MKTKSEKETFKVRDGWINLTKLVKKWGTWKGIETWYTAPEGLPWIKAGDHIQVDANVRIGDGVTIGSQCHVQHNTIIEMGVNIESNSTVGKSATIPTGTVLGLNSFVPSPVKKRA